MLKYMQYHHLHRAILSNRCIPPHRQPQTSPPPCSASCNMCLACSHHAGSKCDSSCCSENGLTWHELQKVRTTKCGSQWWIQRPGLPGVLPPKGGIFTQCLKEHHDANCRGSGPAWIQVGEGHSKCSLQKGTALKY